MFQNGLPTRSTTDFFHHDTMGLVAHSKPPVILICCDAEEPRDDKTLMKFDLRGDYPASPSFFHISAGNSFWASVLAATSSGISRPRVWFRMANVDDSFAGRTTYW